MCAQRPAVTVQGPVRHSVRALARNPLLLISAPPLDLGLGHMLASAPPFELGLVEVQRRWPNYVERSNFLRPVPPPASLPPAALHADNVTRQRLHDVTGHLTRDVTGRLLLTVTWRLRVTHTDRASSSMRKRLVAVMLTPLT
ncbi:hypothetical protein VNO78_20100 [Psophocarpus tetragonolobus]|uniref:Uncharacterized protein n=1 Tax=Psophocarpus tetragonolobus TaxID=3891 RepID=A0AAN9S9S3_PSOTE